ncbi:MAG: glycosyltransferase family 4 protein [bacterium]|nr:glycosyltransferase family 4 protein [bacterium]
MSYNYNMETKPVVIVFSSFYEPMVGGAEIAVKEIIARTARDFEFHIITHRLNFNLPAEENYAAGGGTVFIHRLGFGTSPDRMFLFPFLAARKGFALTKEFKGRKKLLWGVMVSYASIGAFFIKIFKKNIPFLLTVQEGDGEWNVKAKNFGLSALWWKLLLKKANHVTAISNYLAQIVKEKGYRGTVEIIPNGVDEKLLLIQRPEFQGEKVIFSSSRLVKKNALEVLLKAAAKIRGEVGFKVIIAGDGPEKKSLMEFSEALDLKDRVEFLGHVPYENLIKLYSGADIFVRPSRSEGLGSSFLEAMAAGLITIGTPVGGITDYLWEGSTGFLAIPDNVDSLVEAIRTALVLAPSRKAQIIGNARALIRTKYLWSDVALKTKNVFIKLL